MHCWRGAIRLEIEIRFQGSRALARALKGRELCSAPPPPPSAVPAIMDDRRLFLRERADGAYHTLTYILYKFIEEAFISLLGEGGAWKE